jgi:hypothetical protein
MQMTIRFISTVALAVVMSITPKCNSGSGQGGSDQRGTGWDSGELQKQIGNKNSDKRKLVMRVWYDYAQQSNGSYNWMVKYSMTAENHNQLGSGWHQVSDLSSFTFNAVIELPNGVATINETRNLEGKSYYEGNLGLHNTAVLPVFKSKTATGSRSGGPSGISITWP